MEQLVISISDALPAVKGLLWFPLNHSDVQFFSQLAPSDHSRIKITFQEKLHRLLFSDIFCLPKTDQISTIFRNHHNFADQFALYDKLTLRLKNMFISTSY